MQNIGADNAGDAFYRYKMPKLQAKIEGRGNGIKTNVVNCVEIAKALERPPGYVVKYFGCELGAQTKFDKDTGTSIVNGAHDNKKLAEVLEGFIKTFVQCYSCSNPETVVKIRKECVHLKCKACGFTSDVDMRHKLNTFILKNPPESKLSKNEAKVKKAEKEKLKELDAAAKAAAKADRKARKEREKNGGTADGDAQESGLAEENSSLCMGDGDGDEDEEDDAADDVVWKTDVSAQAMAARAQEQLTDATAALVTAGNEAAQADLDRIKAEEAAAEEAAKAAAAAALTERMARLEAADEHVASVRALLDEGGSPGDVAAALKAIKVKGKDAGRLLLLWQAVMDFATGHLHQELERYEKHFSALAPDMKGQAAVMVAYEKYLGDVAPDKQSLAPHVLKTMYELDIVDEEVICLWWETEAVGAPLKVSPEAAAAMRKVTQPVYAWLKDASEDDEDEG